MRILIVEDDKYLAEALEHILKKEKFQIDKVDNGEDGYYYGKSAEYDAIVLDVMLPKMNGFDVIKKLRQDGINTPTIMLTAKSDLHDVVAGLEKGADDYLTKPFEPKELIARLRALTRRVGTVLLEELKYEDLVLNIDNLELTCTNKQIVLSNKEFLILKTLMASPSVIISKEDLIVKVWGYDSEAEDNNVEAYISFLRKKLEYLNTSVAINTIRKVGYKLGKKD
ncbi:MAG: response regulator transcription factor [Lachnospirales bacterium]